MNPEQAGSYLAFYYREPLTLEFDGAKVFNPRVRDVIEWIRHNYESEMSIDHFIEKVKANFKVTADHPFPMIQHLNEIYWREDTSPHQSPYRNTANTGYISGALLEYSHTHDVTFEPSEDVKDTPLEVLCRDEREIPFDEMLKKYGVRLTFEAVKCNNQNATEIQERGVVQ